MPEILIRISSDTASDSWGFVGVVWVGGSEAYRTLEAFATPQAASDAAELLVAGMLGELLAGREWGSVRDQAGAPPTRRDFNFSALRRRRRGEFPDETQGGSSDEAGEGPGAAGS